MGVNNFYCQGCRKPMNSDDYSNKAYLDLWVAIKKVLCDKCLLKLDYYMKDYLGHIQTTLDIYEKEATKKNGNKTM